MEISSPVGQLLHKALHVEISAINSSAKGFQEELVDQDSEYKAT